MNPDAYDAHLAPADCVCGTALRLCEGCDDARCFQCVPYGTSSCDSTYYYPPSAEEIPA